MGQRKEAFIDEADNKTTYAYTDERAAGACCGDGCHRIQPLGQSAVAKRRCRWE